MTDTVVDLFEYYNEQPAELAAICEIHGPRLEEEDPYIVCKEFLEAVEAIGYTFNYYLDGEPYNLRKIGTEVAEEEMPDTPREGWNDIRTTQPEVGDDIIIDCGGYGCAIAEYEGLAPGAENNKEHDYGYCRTHQAFRYWNPSPIPSCHTVYKNDMK